MKRPISEQLLAPEARDRVALKLPIRRYRAGGAAPRRWRWRPVRQWVLTLPYALRYRCAYDASLVRLALEGIRGQRPAATRSALTTMDQA